MIKTIAETPPSKEAVEIDGVTFAILLVNLAWKGSSATPDELDLLNRRQEIHDTLSKGTSTIFVGPGVARAIQNIDSKYMSYGKYGPDTYFEDERAVIFDHISDEDEESSFRAVLISPDKAGDLIPAISVNMERLADMTLSDRDHDKVNRMISNEPSSPIIVKSTEDGIILVDGLCRAMAAHIAGRPILAMDLSEKLAPEMDEPSIF